MSGFIYCLTNTTIPGLVKIGKTTRDPETRAAEISGSTGVATPFKIEWSRKVRDMDKAESDIHAALAKNRLNKRREFFRCTPAQAFSAAKSLKSFSEIKTSRAKPTKTSARKQRRLDQMLGLALTAGTVCIFSVAVKFDLDPSTVTAATAGIALALTMLFQSAPIVSALRR